MSTNTATGLTVSALATRVGVRPDTIRYYERIGLLPHPARTSGDHRRWPDTTVDRLQFIQGCQRLGLRLTEIRDLLAVRDTGACPCEPTGPLLARRIAKLDAEIARLSSLRTDLARMHQQVGRPDCADPTPGTWRPADPVSHSPANPRPDSPDHDASPSAFTGTRS
jgi:MerR family transcriptional regulator, mercuric resistance operon regulatory protein